VSNNDQNDKVMPSVENNIDPQKKIIKVVDFEKDKKNQNGKKIKIKTF